jgi:hypothetical protein
MCEEAWFLAKFSYQGRGYENGKYIHILDPVGRATRRLFTIQRLLYNVAAPNHVQHIDSNHKVIQWMFFVHGCIDGKCTNNLATTDLE